VDSGLTFRIWDELRAYAKRKAAEPGPEPGLAECTQWLREMLGRRAASLPDTAIAYYAQELCEMIARLRSEPPH
jgi:hypothetical protein